MLATLSCDVNSCLAKDLLSRRIIIIVIIIIVIIIIIIIIVKIIMVLLTDPLGGSSLLKYINCN